MGKESKFRLGLIVAILGGIVWILGYWIKVELISWIGFGSILLGLILIGISFR